MLGARSTDGTTREAFQTNTKVVKGWLRYPELRFLERFDFLAPSLLAVATFALGVALEHLAPGLGVTGPQSLVWGKHTYAA